jgi:hypothetical protein
VSANNFDHKRLAKMITTDHFADVERKIIQKTDRFPLDSRRGIRRIASHKRTTRAPEKHVALIARLHLGSRCA